MCLILNGYWDYDVSIHNYKSTMSGNIRKEKLPYSTYSMVQSPSWEADWFEASQEIPRISRNPKAHYRTHKRPSPVSILGQHQSSPFTHIPPLGDPS